MKPSFRQRLAHALLGKSSAFGPMIARMMLGRPVWPKRDYEQLAREGYQQNPVVNACIALIAKSVADIPWVLYQGKGEKKTEIEDHPFLDLIDAPNPEQDRTALLAAFITQRIISGNGYLERTDEKKFERMELYAHRADRMRVIPGAEGIPEAYEYSVGGDRRRLKVDIEAGTRPILHWKSYNPTDDWYGLSPLDPCAWAIDVLNAGWSYNKQLLENSGAPSGFLMYTGGENKNERMGEEHYQSTLKMLRRDWQGAENAGNIQLLEGGFDYKAAGFNPEELQQEKALNNAARTIAFTLGVPPMLLGIPGDNTYSNYQEARLAFYQETVIPLAREIVRALTRWFAKPLGKGVSIDVNLDNLDALQLARKDHWARIEASKLLTLNEKREAIGYEPIGPDGDIHYASAGMIPLGADDIAGGPEGDEEDDDAGDEKKPGKKPPPKPNGKGEDWASIVH